MSVSPVTPSEHDAQLELEATPIVDLLKKLAILTQSERSLSASLKTIKDSADAIEEIVLQRMMNDDTPSMTVALPDGKKMKFTVSSRSYPKMVQGSLAAAQAIENYASRLYAEGRNSEADSFMMMLTIKGQSLEPVLREWLASDIELPPEFAGAIEPSTRFSLSKTSTR